MNLRPVVPLLTVLHVLGAHAAPLPGQSPSMEVGGAAAQSAATAATPDEERARLAKALAGESRLVQLSKELDAALASNSEDGQKILALFAERKQLIESVAARENVDLAKIRRPARAAPARGSRFEAAVKGTPSTVSATDLLSGAALRPADSRSARPPRTTPERPGAQAPATAGQPAESGGQVMEFTGVEVTPTVGAVSLGSNQNNKENCTYMPTVQESSPSSIKLYYYLGQNDGSLDVNEVFGQSGGTDDDWRKSCGFFAHWRFGTVAIPGPAVVTAYLELSKLQLNALSTTAGGSATTRLTLRYGMNQHKDCELPLAKATGANANNTFGPTPAAFTCELGKFPKGILQVGPQVRVDTIVPQDENRISGYAIVGIDRLVVEVKPQ